MNEKRNMAAFQNDRGWLHGGIATAVAIACALLLAALLFLTSCASEEEDSSEGLAGAVLFEDVNDIPYADEGESLVPQTAPLEEEAVEEEPIEVTEVPIEEEPVEEEQVEQAPVEEEQTEPAAETSDANDTGNAGDAVDAGSAASSNASSADAAALRAALNISEDYRSSFVHGAKGAEYQRYIVLHDTEGNGDAASVISYWDGNGSGVAAHFIINKDGSIVQCVPLDSITHHAGFGDTGHNALYGVPEDGRDDRVGTEPIGSWASDYGMNSYSIGIELVHVGGQGGYPEAQLEALDGLIAYLDAYYGGYAGDIIDHKEWRSGNSDTSAEFAGYLASYKSTRKHA